MDVPPELQKKIGELVVTVLSSTVAALIGYIKGFGHGEKKESARNEKTQNSSSEK